MAKKNTSKKKLTQKTMWQRFVGEKLTDANASYDDIIGFIAKENACIIAMSGGFSEDAFAAFIDECIEFFFNFIAKYGDNKKLMRQINDNWSHVDGPAIFRAASNNLGLEDNWKRLSPVIASNVITLTDYIFSLREDRYVTVMCDFTQQQFAFPKTIPHNELLGAKTLLMAFVASATFSKVGSVVFRYGGEEGEECTIEGFLIKNGAVIALPASEMKSANETMLDGSIVPEPLAKYRTPAVIFRRA